MNRDISVNLSAVGFSEKYVLYSDGRVIETPAAAAAIIPKDRHTIVLEDSKGKKQRITLKNLYRKAFSKEYCIDTIESLNDEVWKEIEGTNGRYFISNCGRLKSYCKYSARIVKPYRNQYGYARADIWKNGKRETVLIHRLVAKAFVENDSPKEKDTVDHIDGNKNNNTSSNLRWLSRSANTKAYYATLPRSE